MKKFYFSSGELQNYVVMCENADEVFEIALDENPQVKALGLIYSIKEEGLSDDEELFGHTETMLGKLKKWGYEEDVLMAKIVYE